MSSHQKKRVEDAAAKLSEKGLVRDRDFRVIVAPDQHLLSFVDPETQDIVTYVATLHHHSYIDTPVRHAKMTMKKDGVLVVSDWHNPEWEHPNRVYEALAADFDWETKKADLDAFAEAYPKAMEVAPTLSHLDHASYMEIRGFWRGWVDVRKKAVEEGSFDERDDILMLESHRPVEMQNQTLMEAGFDLHPNFEAELIDDGIMKSNPDQLLDTSRLLMTMVVQKKV